MKNSSRKKNVPVNEAAQLKLIKNLRFVLLQHLSSRGYRLSTREELVKRLAILPEQETIFHRILDDLQTEGITRNLGKSIQYCGPGSADHVEGPISFHPKGFAFVRVDVLGEHELNGQDIFIPPGFSLNALPSDRVCVEVTGHDARGYDGKVVHIIQRGKNSLHGVISEIYSDSKAGVHVSALAQNHRCVIDLKPEEKVQVGDRVVVKVTSWEHKEHMIQCELVEIIGSIEDPSLDVDIGIEEAGLTREFPESVLQEALSFGKRVSLKEISKRRDLRDLPTVTIDPDTAKDFDDAISVERRAHGYFLAVHIADVAHYVTYGSHLDQEAQKRGNSTYFPGYCLPMLPSELSNELCSLKPNVNRLTVSVLVDFDHDGRVIDYEICRSVIKSQKRLTYKQALAILEGKASSPHSDLIHLMKELCLKLKEIKKERGGVDLNVHETVVKCDNTGQPYGSEVVHYDITHQMIEEFMVKANEIVASHLSKLERAAMYRVHEAPRLEDFRDFFQLARFYGHPIKELPTPQEWQKLFQEIQNAPYCHQLTTAYIRSMRLAQYHPTNVGHFGLALEHYTHFTSPIRRYCDLTVMRALFNEPRHADSELSAIAVHCCDTERNSSKAEQSVNHLKKIRLLDYYLKNEAGRSYKAIITKVKPFGLFFDLQEFMLEGFIHISDLSEDYFYFDEARHLLRGKTSGLVLRIGEEIEVQTRDVDLIFRQCDWMLNVEWASSKSEKSPQRRDDEDRLDGARSLRKALKNAASKKSDSKKDSYHKSSKEHSSKRREDLNESKDFSEDKQDAKKSFRSKESNHTKFKGKSKSGFKQNHKPFRGPSKKKKR